MDLALLNLKVDSVWSEMLALVTEPAGGGLGPPDLLRCELHLLEGCIQDAKNAGDTGELQRCLDKMTHLMKHFKSLRIKESVKMMVL